MQCGGGDNPQRDNNVSSSSRCNCVQRVQEALLRCCRGVVGCQRSSQQSEAYLFSVSNPLHSTDEVRMVSHPQKHRFRNGIPWNWLHVARRFTGLLMYSCGVLFRSFIYGLDVGFFIGQCWWRKNRARRWSSEQREWCAGELEESRKADKARRVLETLMSLFDFWLFLSIRNWNMEYKFELLKTVLIGWFWLRGHIIRPPLIQDPMRKFLCWNITEDPGSSISGGGGGGLFTILEDLSVGSFLTFFPSSDSITHQFCLRSASSSSRLNYCAVLQIILWILLFSLSLTLNFE